MVILPCTLADVAFSLVSELRYKSGTEFLYYGSIGLIVAQIGLLNLGLVFISEPFEKRLAMAWCVALVCYLCWLLGYCHVQTQGTRVSVHWEQVVVTVACLSPLIALATQFPLWVARLVLGWRLVRARPQDEPAPAETKLSILNLLTTTAVVAISVAAARAIPDVSQDLDLIFVLVGWAFAALVLLVMLPLFLCRRSLFFSWLTTILLGILVGAGMYWLYEGFLGFPGVTPLYMLSFTPLLAIATALTLLRRAGWRLTSRRGHLAKRVLNPQGSQPLAPG